MTGSKNKTRHDRPSAEKLAYFAGYFDGEGCIHIARKKPYAKSRAVSFQHSLQIKIASVNPAVLYEILSYYGGTICKQKKTLKENWRIAWNWHLCSRASTDFISDVLPFLVLKRQEAELALEFQRKCLPKRGKKRLSEDELSLREGYCQKMSALKHVSYESIN